MDSAPGIEASLKPNVTRNTATEDAEYHVSKANGSSPDPADPAPPASIKKEQTKPINGKTTSDDSEAETEILGASQKNTPVKKPPLRRSITDDSAPKAESSSPDKHVNGGSNERSSATEELQRSRKRKVRASEGPDGQRDHARSSGRRGAQKRARLSQSEDDADQDRFSSESGVNSEDETPAVKSNLKLSKSRSRPSGIATGAEDRVPASRSKRDTLAELDLTSSTRRSVASSTGRSQSPRPSLRNRHRRASSFHAPSLGPERERRSRRRLGSQDEEGPARSPSTASMPKTPRDTDRNGRTQLARASDEGDAIKVSAILSVSTADVNRPDFAGNSPLQLAACKGHRVIVEALIDHGANVNSWNNSCETALKDAEDNEHVRVIELLKAAGATLDPPGNARASGPKHRHHYQTPSIAKLLEFIKQGDLEGINLCCEAGFSPNNECMVAAVRTRNQELVGLLLGIGGPSDPEPPRADPTRTPMLAAIGNGCVPIIELLLSNGCDPTRKVLETQRSYKQVAQDRGGPQWREEYRVFARAIAGRAYVDSLSPSPPPPPPPPVPAPSQVPPTNVPQAQVPSPPNDDEDVETQSSIAEASEHVSPTQITSEELRDQYLAIMPRGIRQALVEGPEKVLYPSHTDDKARRYLRPTSKYSPIFTFPRHEIEPDVSANQADEMWMCGWQGSVLLGHHRLDEIKHLVSTTMPITRERREALLHVVGFQETLVLDYDYERIAFLPYFESFCKEHGMPCQLIRAKNKPDVVTGAVVWWQRIANDECRKFADLPDDQLFWIKVDDFVALTHPEKSPRLHGFSIRTMDFCHIDIVKDDKGKWTTRPGAPERTEVGYRSFSNGKWLSAPSKPSSQQIKVTAYGTQGGKRTFTGISSGSTASKSSSHGQDPTTNGI
ncbi:MAG: hypothetical protein M1828_005900 [Chrysothrix sp. TS-e1954]|nr:MAG: hypothetical protein M1828_005900 [Chrysothrix sp. TS-e1954]